MTSLLEQFRLNYHPSISKSLNDLNKQKLIAHPSEKHILPEIASLFPKSKELPAWRVEKGEGTQKRPLRVGVFFSGGQASGGHNVLSGLFDGLMQIHTDSILIGFLDGPSGLISNQSKILTKSMIDSVRNLGGFDLIGSGRTKIETPEQFLSSAQTAKILRLDAIVVVGGDDSNTNAAHLAEYFLQNHIKTSVIGIPKTIDGDLRSANIDISFGFDSATKTFAELIGNIARDALSAKKYYHFIKLMGRSASHIALECALLTHPNLVLIGEERKSLSAIVQDIVHLILDRKKAGKDYGIILVPEGLLEFIPEFQNLIHQDISILEKDSFFQSLPKDIRGQLLNDRDPHGNIQFSQIETEKLLLDLVKNELKKSNQKINALTHFFGYEGRACFPTNFDANYCYNLGLFAAIAIRDNATGIILAIKNLADHPVFWEPHADALVHLLDFETRSGKKKAVIAKTLVDLNGKAFLHLKNARNEWRINDHYQTLGPIQFFGERTLTDSVPQSIRLL